MTRLIVISNRVSPPDGEGKSNQGGLAVALSSALRETNGIWFGWSGNDYRPRSAGRGGIL